MTERLRQINHELRVIGMEAIETGQWDAFNLIIRARIHLVTAITESKSD
jgi:hypothetical protein